MMTQPVQNQICSNEARTTGDHQVHVWFRKMR
jgi:hypothetical protein